MYKLLTYYMYVQFTELYRDFDNALYSKAIALIFRDSVCSLYAFDHDAWALL